MLICLYRYIKSRIILSSFEKKIESLKRKYSEDTLMYLEMTYDLLEAEKEHYFNQLIKHISLYSFFIILFYVSFKFWEYLK